MKIIVDVMSGDNAPLEILKGAVMAASEIPNETFVLVGQKETVERTARENDLDISGMEIVHADEVVTMEDDPIAVVRGKKNSSMMTALTLLSEGKGDVVVSAGNTGALFSGASLIVRKMKGVQRAAIATVLPFKTPALLLDSGANLVINDEVMEQFAYMGSAYMRKMYDLESPRVGILNNGEEECKGLSLQIESYKRLKANKEINFVGNVEANRLIKGACDVIVTDGFTGNILLKTVEGMGKMMLGLLKSLFTTSFTTKLSYLLVKKHLGQVKKDFDPAEHGGAPILGIAKPVIKAHGSSNARAIRSAVHQAVAYANSGVMADIERQALAFHEKRRAEKAEKKPEAEETAKQ